MSIALLLLTSCDQNKGKIEKLTNLFIAAVNGHDKATIYDMFPDIKTLENLSIPDSIPIGDITIKKDETTGGYIASIDNTRSQKILFKSDGANNFKIQDTYCIFEIDSVYNELALKTGVPLKQITDRKVSELFVEDSEYLNFLYEEYSSVINGNLTYESGTWNAHGGWYPSVNVSQPIRNVGTVPIKADEYTVEFNFYCPNGTAGSQKIVEVGVDLQPGEAYTFMVYPMSGYYNACMNHDFNWTVSFVYKNRSPLDALLQYAKFSGKEYNDFKAKHPQDNGDTKAKTDINRIIVTGVNVRLRTSPEINNTNIIKDSNGKNLHPNKGDILDCIGESGDFYKVKYLDKEAYISKKFAEPK